MVSTIGIISTIPYLRHLLYSLLVQLFPLLLKMYLSCDLKELSYKLINCPPGERKFFSWPTAAEI